MKRTQINDNTSAKIFKGDIDKNVFYINSQTDLQQLYQFPNTISNIILDNNYKQISEKYTNIDDIKKRLKTCYKIISNLDIQLQNDGWQVIFTYENKDKYYYHNSITNEVKKISWSYL
tara:strand:+ start:175 stop:528 length:354 start_codon:yes stop_codon:yes gene_type:complete